MYKISTPLEISDLLVLQYFVTSFETLSHNTRIPIFTLIYSLLLDINHTHIPLSYS